MADGSKLVDDIAVADAHPLGARPFARADYIRKFRTLAQDVLESKEIERFIRVAENTADLKAKQLSELTIVAKPGLLASASYPKGLF